VRRALAGLAPLLIFAGGCGGLGKLDWPPFGRDGWQRPSDVVRALDLKPGSHVADLGAGEGYFVPHLADAVGRHGRVYAVEVEADGVAELAERFRGRDEVVPTLGDFDDPRLPDGSLDVVLIVNTYHHIEDRPAYFRRLRRDLAPGGRVAVIEPDSDLTGVLAWTLDAGHTSSARDVVREMEEGGYRRVASHDFLPLQIFQVFSPE
jgi:ubiquinone/menaquinone biosynthesis C-methylase UbiE